uniref:UBC core domain-containing protein n=1 Tax=Sus scrofa TaxID=9823 RepID=A0A8D0Z8L7_PIG
MTASKRVAKELEDLQKELPRYLGKLFSDDANVLVWHALLLPEKPSYTEMVFILFIYFYTNSPFLPPSSTSFVCRILNALSKARDQTCNLTVTNQTWADCKKCCYVLEALNVLVNRPEPGQPLRVELADQLTQDPELFNRKAEEFTLQFGVDRPS